MTKQHSFIGVPLVMRDGTPAYINPGTGPIENASEAKATENIKQFLVDCLIADIHFIRVPKRDYGNGRYAFRIWRSHVSKIKFLKRVFRFLSHHFPCLWRQYNSHIIQMPGLPLVQVRFMGEEGQDAWDFPRLYVDGSSWLWKYALLEEKDFERIIGDH